MKAKDLLDNLKEDKETLNLQLYSKKAKAFVWYASDLDEYVTVLEFGSGRVHTINLPDLDRALDVFENKLDVIEANIVRKDGSEKVEVNYESGR